ncbi:MAG: AAA family ATPase [Pseudomonadota bacterium]
MSQTLIDVNAASTTAPLQNVSLCTSALSKSLNRPQQLPGLVAFYGPSGWGKTFAAAYAANHFQAYYVEVKECWTKKAFLEFVLKEMGILPEKVMYKMIEQIAEQLVLSGKPLIVDEMDYLIKRNYTDLIRDIYESSRATILMIGEEQLEANLRQHERFHNRVMEWIPAQPANIDDMHHLVRLYARGLKITDDLLEYVRIANKGCTRRICINIEKIRSVSVNMGLDTMDRNTWGDQPLYTGTAPKRRL